MTEPEGPKFDGFSAAEEAHLRFFIQDALDRIETPLPQPEISATPSGFVLETLVDPLSAEITADVLRQDYLRTTDHLLSQDRKASRLFWFATIMAGDEELTAGAQHFVTLLEEIAPGNTLLESALDSLHHAMATDADPEPEVTSIVPSPEVTDTPLWRSMMKQALANLNGSDEYEVERATSYILGALTSPHTGSVMADELRMDYLDPRSEDLKEQKSGQLAVLATRIADEEQLARGAHHFVNLLDELAPGSDQLHQALLEVRWAMETVGEREPVVAPVPEFHDLDEINAQRLRRMFRTVVSTRSKIVQTANSVPPPEDVVQKYDDARKEVMWLLTDPDLRDSVGHVLIDEVHRADFLSRKETLETLFDLTLSVDLQYPEPRLSTSFVWSLAREIDSNGAGNTIDESNMAVILRRYPAGSTENER